MIYNWNISIGMHLSSFSHSLVFGLKLELTNVGVL